MADSLKGYSLYEWTRFPGSERCEGVRMGGAGYNHIANNRTPRSCLSFVLFPYC